MSVTFAESTVEVAALESFAGLGYRTLHGFELAPDSDTGERESLGQVVLPKE